MRGAVVLRGSEQAGVITKAQALHQRGDELLGGKAAKGVILGRHDDVVAACRRGDEPLLGQSVEGHLGRCCGHAESVPGVGGIEEVSSRPGKAFDVLPSIPGVSFHMHKVTIFVTVRKRNVCTQQPDAARSRHTDQRRQVAVGVGKDQRLDDASLTEQGVADPRSYVREHIVALRDPERVERGEPEAGEPPQSRPVCALVIV